VHLPAHRLADLFEFQGHGWRLFSMSIRVIGAAYGQSVGFSFLFAFLFVFVLIDSVFSLGRCNLLMH
jgi:hypothetical protein